MLKKTKTREKILELFNNTTTPMSAYDIYDVLGKDGITLSSIYRTLDSFYKNNIIMKETTQSAVAIYTLIRDEHCHILECKTCHTKVKLDYCPYHKANESLKSKHKFIADERNVVIYGTCENCTKKS